MPVEQCRAMLVAPGLVLGIGPFTARIRTPIRALAEDVRAIYGAHEVLRDATAVDFDVAVRPSRGLRGYWRPQARFFSDGQEPFHPLPLDQAAPFLEWGLNWCIAAHAHDLLVLHAAVLARGGRALLMPAPSGSGKSTLAAALAHAGWRLYSDELALIDPSSGRVFALDRAANLKNAAIDLVRRRFPKTPLRGIARNTSKGTVALMCPPLEPGAVADASEAVPAWVILPRWIEGAATDLLPIGRAQAFLQLADNAMNYSIHGRRGFEALCRTVADAACFTLIYGDIDEAMAAIARRTGC